MYTVPWDKRTVWPLEQTVCSWARHFTLRVPLSTQVYKWTPVNLMLAETLKWTSIPSRESRNTPSHFMPWKPEINLYQPDGILR